jgi:tetrahydromethanopterin:alpha-L-glutamate ligase
LGRVVIFTDDPGWHGRELTRAFAARGFVAHYASLTQCRIDLASEPMIVIPGCESGLPDAVFVRGVPGGSLQDVIFYLDILHTLKMLGIPVYNDAGAIERSVDKAMTSVLLQRAGLNLPPTWVLKDRETATAIAEQELQNGHALISKPLFGSQGEGVRCYDKSTDLFWLADSYGVFYLQRFVRCAGIGYSDIRAFVIHGEVVAVMRRRGQSWLNNVARGARCEEMQADAELKWIACRAVQALSMDYAGVDLIENRQGEYIVIEVNSIPAWKGLQSVCGINIADLLVADLLLRKLPQPIDDCVAMAS